MLALANKLTISTQPIYRFVNKYSIDFDGVDDRIITDGADTVAQPTTYSFWCKSSTTTNNKGIFGHGQDNLGGFHFNYDGTRPLLYLGSSFFVYWNDTSAQDDGEWHHWVVYSDTNDLNNCKLYVDGVLQTVSSINSSGSLSSYTESLTIGSDRQVGGYCFEGNIDEFAVYDRELTQAEITRMYNTYYSPNRIANGNFAQEGVEEVTNGDFSQIGSELVTNGDFATDSDWNLGNGWSITNGELVGNNATSIAYQAISAQPNTTYQVTFTITNYVSGNALFLFNGGSNTGTPRTSVGTYTEYITTDSSANGNFSISRTQNFTGSIDNVSVKEVGQDWSFDAGWSMGDSVVNGNISGSLKYLYQNVGIVLNKTYKATIEVKTLTSGSVNFYYFNGSSFISVASNLTLGTHTFYFTVSGGTNSYIYVGSSAFVGTVDNISVKEVGQHWAAESGVTFQPIDGIATIISNGSFTGINQDTSINFGNTYRVTIEHKNTTADFRVYVGNQAFDTISTASDFTTSVVDIVAVGTSQTVFILPSQAAQTIQVKSIVVQELKHDATNLMLNAGDYQSANPLITSTKSMEFDGVDNYLIVNEGYDYDNRTFATWFNSADNTKTGAHPNTILSQTASSGGNRWHIRIDDTDNQVKIYDGGTIILSGNINTTTIEENRWYNVVMTEDGTTLKFYINGIIQGSGSVTLVSASDDVLTFGQEFDSTTPTDFFKGEMTEAGVWNRVLTDLEVASLYNQGMPTNLLVNRNNYQSGNPTVFNTKQVDFDGTDDFLNAGNVLNLGTSDFSISMWVNSSQTTNRIMGKTQDDANRWYIRSTGNKVQFHSKSGGAVTMNLTTTETFPVDTWAHLLISADRDGTVYIYINGVQSSVTASGSATSLDNTGDLTIGKVTFFDSYFDGKISQVGMWDKALTADEVSSLYNHGLPIDLTTNQAAYASSSNLVGYWRMGSGLYDNYPSIGSLTYGVIADQTNATLGDELIVNGDFATDSNWTKNSGWTISGGKARRDGVAAGGNSPISQTVNLVAGKVYKLSYDRTYTSNGGETNLYSEFITDGSYTTLGSYNDTTQETVTITSYFSPTYTGTMTLNMYGIGTFTGTVDNISLKEFGGNPAIMTNQTSSDIENGSPYANILQNGDFSDGSTGWNLGTGASVVNNELVLSNSSSNTYKSVSHNINTQYRLSLEIKSVTSGSVRLDLAGGGAATSEFSTVGTHSEIVTAIQSGSFFVKPTSFTGTIDNIKVEEVNTGLQGYWKMGDGTNDEYPVIYDQTNPTLSADISVWAGEDVNVSAYVGIESNTTTDLVVGKMYRLAFTVSNYISGSFRFRQPSGGVDLGVTGTANGDYVQYGIATNTAELDCDAFNLGFVGTIGNYSVQEVQGNPATMTNMVEGNITNQYPLTKIRNYYRMGDGILDGYPIIQDQTSPNLAHIPTTNVVIYSNTLTQSAVSGNITTTLNYGVAPDGTTTSTRAISNGNYNANISILTSINNNTKYIISGYFKLNSGTPISSSKLETYSGLSSNINLFDEYQNGNLTSEWRRFIGNTSVSTGTTCRFALRFDSAVDIEFWGLQLEEQSQATAYLESDGIAAERKSSTTNLVPYSEDFSQASQVQNVTLTANAITSPTGTSNGTKVLSSDNNSKVSYTNISFTNGTTYTLSVYCRNIDATALKLFIYNAGGGDITDDFTSQVNTTSWTRVSTTFTASQDTSSGQVQFARNLPSGESAYFWGFQLEEQTQAETYAKTTGLPVTIDLFTENNYGTMTNMSASDIVEDTP